MIATVMFDVLGNSSTLCTYYTTDPHYLREAMNCYLILTRVWQVIHLIFLNEGTYKSSWVKQSIFSYKLTPYMRSKMDWFVYSVFDDKKTKEMENVENNTIENRHLLF